ncbi:MAG TPA: transcription antitermination factor NusB [Fimbriiglobus sp.]|nr:transcription antitermination factor NusB [Fimbriiglobus sp.]
MTTAREVAVDVLNEARTANAWASELVDEHLARAKLSPQDRRFVTQLVFGVIRRKATLDALLKPFVTRPFHTVEPAVVDVLRLGAFQLALLTHVPKHAAVFETVNLARHVGSRMARGFVNGVLRRVAEVVTDEFVDGAAQNAIPFDAASPPVATGGLAPTPRYRKLTRDLLPDPAADPPGYLAAAFSWPRWLADRWLARYGRDECFRLGSWFNAPPSLWLRVNKLKLDRESYRLILAAKGIDSEPGEHPQSLHLLDGASIRELPGYAEGEFTVQDLSSMAVASAVNPQPGWRVLDLCAAPGGKTTHLAELMQNRGRIVACDIDPKRLDTVTAICQRLGVSIVEPYLLDKEDTNPPAGPFHAALVDVPCSNTGVLGRRPEVRWRLRPDEFEDLIRLQTRLLFTAIDRVRPNGVIVYSTCSIEPDENEGVVKAVRRAIKGLTVEAEAHAIPGRLADGGYWARMRKPG